MKEPLYSILDGEYCFLLERITKNFQKRGLNPAIVGGAAVQTHVANNLSKIHNKCIEDIFLEETNRPQDHIRGTDDIDLAVYNSDFEKDLYKYHKTILEATNSIACKNMTSPDQNDIYDVEIERMGLRRPVLRVNSLNKHSRIMLNISNAPNHIYHLDPKVYKKMIENAKIIKLCYNEEFNPEINVYAFEDLLASKLAHNRPKDQFDVMTLGKSAYLAKLKIDKERMLHILGETTENKERIARYFNDLKLTE